MPKVNENDLAKCVTKCCTDRNKQQVTIAQCKEVQNALLDHLAALPASAVMELVERHKETCCHMGQFAGTKTVSGDEASS